MLLLTDSVGDIFFAVTQCNVGWSWWFFLLSCTYLQCCNVWNIDPFADIVIDEEFARSKGCAMPELVNLMDDEEVLLHLKVRPATLSKITIFTVILTTKFVIWGYAIVCTVHNVVINGNRCDNC